MIFLLSKRFSRVFSSTTARKHQIFGALPSLRFNSHLYGIPILFQAPMSFSIDTISFKIFMHKPGVLSLLFFQMRKLNCSCPFTPLFLTSDPNKDIFESLLILRKIRMGKLFCPKPLISSKPKSSQGEDKCILTDSHRDAIENSVLFIRVCEAGFTFIVPSVLHRDILH